MTRKRMDWDSAEARADLICRVGPAKYNAMLAQHHRDSVVAVVNGYAIRKVRSSYGALYIAEGLRAGTRTLEEAKAMAAAAPAPLTEREHHMLAAWLPPKH